MLSWSSSGSQRPQTEVLDVAFPFAKRKDGVFGGFIFVVDLSFSQVCFSRCILLQSYSFRMGLEAKTSYSIREGNLDS